MALYVVPIDAPAAGADWETVVPGQYLWNVTGITATLATPNTSSIAFDSSGDGFDGTYDGSQTFVPGLVAGNEAVQLGPGAFPFGISHVAIPPELPDLTHPFTFEFWANIAAPGVGWLGMLAYIAVGGTVNGFLEIYAEQASATDGDIHIGAYTITWASVVVPNLFDGNPKHVVVTSDTVAMHVYIDGVEVPSAEVGGPNPFTTFTAATGSIGSTAGVVDACGGILDEVAIYSNRLTDAQVAAHYAAASVSFAAYTAAVLSGSPDAYYHLDEIAGGGRQVDLLVTNGTSEVLEIPTGFAVPTGTGPFAYSWSPSLRSSTQTPTSEAIAVAIPRLVLPAGYTIGARTLDIGVTDQWSDVTLWWDSSYQDRQHPIDPYAFPPGALLRFVQTGGQP